MYYSHRTGATLIEVVLGIGFVVMLFGAIYVFYDSVFGVVTSMEFRTLGTALLNREAETVRNLAYEDVGIQGGIPSGVLAHYSVVTSTPGKVLTIQRIVRNIDDPFDGMLGGAPNDTAPADYKLVEIQVACVSCPTTVPLSLTLRVAPKNLEGASNDGSLFVNVFDANGVGVPSASVHVVNVRTSPTIDLTDTTNAAGVLQLVGVPTSTQGYSILVTKEGFSSDRTYAPGDSANPNPSKPDATVAAQTLTQTSFQIDANSSLEVRSVDTTCTAIPDQPFSWKGSKLIGTNPDILKFSTTSRTGLLGDVLFSGVEWDTYALTYMGAFDLMGQIPLSPIAILPGTQSIFSWVIAPAQPKSLYVVVQDSETGAPIQEAKVSITKNGSTDERTTGHAIYTESDWSIGKYFSEQGTELNPSGFLQMDSSAGAYSTTTAAWLVSNTIDLGTSTARVNSLGWLPTFQPVNTELRFQIAANNDQVTWNFVGPGNNPNAYFMSSDFPMVGMVDGNRYLRYKAYLSTQDEVATPSLQSVSIDFAGPCVPPGQLLFQNLSGGTYTIQATADGYGMATGTVAISDDWTQKQIGMTHL